MQKNWRRVLYVTVSLLLSFQSSVASAVPTCEALHSEPVFQESLRIKADESLTVSELHLNPQDLSKNPEAALEQLIYMSSQTSQLTVVPKETLEKNEMVLGLPLKDGYILEMTYSSKSQVEPTFTLDKIEMVSPTGRQTLLKNALKFDQLMLKESKLKLEGIFPVGYSIEANLPLKIDGAVLENYTRKILPYLPLFKKSELAEISKTKSLKRFRFEIQYRAIKHLIFEALLSKSSVRKIFQYSIFIGIGFGAANGFHFRDLAPPVTPSTSISWLKEMNGNLATNLKMPANASTQSELQSLNQELNQQMMIYPARVKLQTQDLPFLVQKGMKVSENQFAWILEDTKAQQTYLVFSRGHANGSIEYFSLAINPQTYPNLISRMEKAGFKMELK